MLVGPAQTGKLTAARLFAQALLCERPGSGGCGQCATCQAVAAGRHPDVRVWDVPETEKTFKVEQVRELIAAVSRKPFQAERTVHILAAVDAMAIAGANALLKTLEEPPPSTTLILLAKDLDSLLPTIVSRTQVVPFGLTAPEAIAAYLRACVPAPPGAPPDHFDRMAVRAEGRLGRAIELAATPPVTAPPPALPEAPGVAALAWADRLAALPAPEQQAALTSLIAWLRDAAWLAAGGTPHRLVSTADATSLAAAAATRPAEQWVALAEAVEAGRDALERHGNARLVLDRVARELSRG